MKNIKTTVKNDQVTLGCTTTKVARIMAIRVYEETEKMVKDGYAKESKRFNELYNNTDEG